MDRVTVYRFKLDDAFAGPADDTLAPRAATAETIRQIMGATPVVESAQVVDRHCIDCHGFLVESCWPDSGPPGLGIFRIAGVA